MGTEEAERNEEREADPRVGTVLQNRYRILERLAEGGMGVVYRAERLMIERTVAIKFLHAGFAANPDSRKRFERELKAMSRLNHPNCISVVDFGFDEGPYFVMDYITGRTLKDELSGGRLMPARAIYITNQILAALTHAHGQDMVHRDIKPANVILTNAEGAPDHAYVLDFGLAKFVSSSRDDLTASWMVLGTPAYMSPEQARGDNVDVPSDVYSTGALLFELLTGDKLYSSESPIETLQKHQSAPIPALRDRVPDGAFSEELELVVRKALAKEPGRRFRSAGEFAEALEAVPEAGYLPRASSQLRAHTASLLAEAAAQRAASVELLSLADAMEVQNAGEAARRTGGKPAAPESLAHTVPLQVATGSGPAGDSKDGAAEDGAGEAKASATVSLRKEADASPAAGKHTAGSASQVAGEEARRRDTGAAASRPSGARIALALMLPAMFAAGAWYLLSGSNGAGADSSIAIIATAGEEIGDTVQGQGQGQEKEKEKEKDGNAEEQVATRTETEPAPAPVETIKDVESLIAEGKREEAIQGILRLRRTKFPNSAYLAFLLGNLYFDKVYWSDGIDAYREALELDRSYRTRAKINENAIRALSHDQARLKSNQLFLKHIGKSGLPYLRKAAKADKNPKVRQRAAWLVKQLTRRR